MIKYAFWKIALVAVKKMEVEKLETEIKEDTVAETNKV